LVVSTIKVDSAELPLPPDYWGHGDGDQGWYLRERNHVKQQKHLTRTRRLFAEPLEERRVLTASVGWDGPGQGSAELSYYIGEAPDYLDQGQVDAAIERALDAWAEVADIQFNPSRQPGQVNALDFSFRPIDGQGGTLARAYFPDDLNSAVIAGDVHFDSRDSWEIGNARGSRAFDLTAVAAHEIGHALGLEHLHQPDSILQASISSDEVFQQLSTADQDAILELYAPRPMVEAETGNNDLPEENMDPNVISPNDSKPDRSKPSPRPYQWQITLHRWGWFIRKIPSEPMRPDGINRGRSGGEGESREFEFSFQTPHGMQKLTVLLNFRFYITPGLPAKAP
jgi:hypothetical protein